MADETKNETGGAGEVKGKDQTLVAAACSVYGIDEKYLLASAVADGEVTLVTAGGAKVRWRKGDKVEALGQIAVTGINPAAAKRKPIVGKKK